jgi:hypothetical protein
MMSIRCSVIRTFGLVFASLLLLAAGTASADTYYIWDDWGGTWTDAEKASDNSEDDLLCWAAAASNVLEWTGWGQVGGMTTSDQMFEYFQDHWTDTGGNPYYGWDWWFDGTNDVQGVSGWAQVDVAGGGFWTGENYFDYLHYDLDEADALPAIDAYLHDGYGTSLSVGGTGAHSTTVWGLETNADGTYAGIYVTDSDDDKGGAAPRPDVLAYYDVVLNSGRWYLDDYYGNDGWYITEVIALDQNPNVVPLPAAAMTGIPVLLILALLRRGRRKRD